jgi:hypothetical protein
MSRNNNNNNDFYLSVRVCFILVAEPCLKKSNNLFSKYDFKQKNKSKPNTQIQKKQVNNTTTSQKYLSI